MVLNDEFAQFNRDPGPGAYDVSKMPTAPSRPASTKSKKSHTLHLHPTGRLNSPSTYVPTASSSSTKPTKKKVAGILVADSMVEADKIRVVAFGTQTPRFPGSGEAQELPPPGAYEIAEAFQTVKSKGRLDKSSILSSQMARELFPGKIIIFLFWLFVCVAFDSMFSVLIIFLYDYVVLPSNPGPGEYDIDRKETRIYPTQPHGSFLSSVCTYHTNLKDHLELF
jgi:hypothetical protein